MVCHQWKTLQFFSHDVSREFEMKHYRYKMIQSGDFYAHVLQMAEKFENVIFSNEKILAIDDNGDSAEVKTDSGVYSAEYVFNSTGLFH
ncbi:hypothetical protein V6O07_16170, partial [Arthrospira platensis SPKY2]